MNKVFIENILLRNFRNLRQVEFTPNGKVNVIIGPNASGKTNFCEALYYTAKGQLLKGDRQRELIGWDQPQTLVELELNLGDRIKVYLNRDTHEKITKLNNRNCSPGVIYDHLQVLLFTPDSLRILKGPPRIRRKFFNDKIPDLYTSYASSIQRYKNIVGKKNAILKKDTFDPGLLEVFNQKLVEYGSTVVVKRLRYIQDINGYLPQIYRKFSTQSDHLELRYQDDIYGGKGLGEIKEMISHRIQSKAEEERQKAYSLIGPHRDDFHFMLDGRDARKYGSQGEQKLSIIALKLAHLKLYHDRFDDYPVLVMDDIMGELDPQRRRRLLNNLPSNIQIFLTYTELVEPLPTLTGDFYILKEGTLKPITAQNQVAKQK